MEHREIEARFLEIDKGALVKKLEALGAKDLGETLLEEIIFYGPQAEWLHERRFARLRKSGNKATLTYKHHDRIAADGAEEIELEVSDIKKAEAFLAKIGFPPYRRQEKKRHKLQLDGITIDIDTWPRIPTYVELEGQSEEALKDVARKLGFDWASAIFHDARYIIENHYHIPVGTMRWFTFDRFE